MNIKKIIPNSVTLLNLFCGCLTLICIFNGKDEMLQLVPLFILVALISDYSDGLLARLLKVSSPLGKELDSLADMVSFGLVPGAMLFYLINRTQGLEFYDIDFHNSATWAGFFGFVVTLFACLRLAKFNLDTRQSEGFVGLNTPACTIFVLGLLLIVLHDLHQMREWILNIPLLFGVALTLAYLLVAEIPMFSFKFKNLQFKDNKVRFAFILITASLLLLFKLGVALSLIIFNYILISVILWLSGNLKREKRDF